MKQVAIIGAGVAGASAARQLGLASGHDAFAIDIYEIGRGPGGRAATRRTRSLPVLRINHGAPYADISTAEGRALVASLDGAVQPYNGRRVIIDAATGTQRLRAQAEGEQFITGTHGEMGNIADGLLRDAAGEMLPGISPRYTQMVRGLSQQAGQWRLMDKTGETLGLADWLVVSGSGVAHPRWSQTFGGEPPLVAAARDLADQRLDEALTTVAGQTAAPVLTVFFYCTGSAAEAWLAMGFEDALLEGHPVLSKVSIQRVDEGGCAVVVHSTADYARDNAGVYGASSSAARVGDASSSADREEEIIDDILAALSRLPTMPDIDTDELAFGPLMHRWGNAFPEGQRLPRSLSVCPQSHVVFCGDYVETEARQGSLESALVAGARAGDSIMSAV